MITLLLSLALAADPCAPLPPPDHLARAQVCGCSIAQAGADPHWYTRVWTELPNRNRWTALYSVRDPEQLKKALADCDLWMKCFRDAATKARKK